MPLLSGLYAVAITPGANDSYDQAHLTRDNHV